MFEILSGALRAPYVFDDFFFARYAREGFEWFFASKKRSNKIFPRSPSARGFETAELFNFFAGCKTWVDFHTGNNGLSRGDLSRCFHTQRYFREKRNVTSESSFLYSATVTTSIVGGNLRFDSTSL